jgi:hypothetical protein
MKNPGLLLGLSAALALGSLLTVAIANNPAPSTPTTATTFSAHTLAQGELLARGDYLVNRVGLCIDCHSPRNEKGEHIASQHLMGAPIPFAPTVPMPWVPAAPRLAGLPAGFSEEQFVHFLMTGDRPDGRGQPLPPMPPYRFEKADAEAIAAYMRSLPGASQ